MRHEVFEVDGPLIFELITGSGDVEVLPGDPATVAVELRGGPAADYLVELSGRDLTVRPPTRSSGKMRLAGTDIKLYVDTESAGEIRTSSGNISIETDVKDLVLATASGDVRVNAAIADDFEVRTASGDVRCGAVGRHVSMATASGDVAIAAVGGDLRFSSASGDLRCGAVTGKIDIRAASSDVSVDAVKGDSVRARTLSGDLRLGIPGGRIVDLDMQTVSGEATSRLTRSSGRQSEKKSLAISLKTVSGDLLLENV